MGGQEDCARVIFVLRVCTWSAPAVSLVLPAFDDIGSPDSPPRQVVYFPVSIVSPWVTASRFLAANMEAEPKLTTFSSFLLFRVFLSFLFS